MVSRILYYKVLTLYCRDFVGYTDWKVKYIIYNMSLFMTTCLTQVVETTPPHCLVDTEQRASRD